MKKIIVTYTMTDSTKQEIAETCITLPVKDKLAALADGKQCGIGRIALEKTLKQIAGLQGYMFREIEMIERVKEQP